MVFSECSDSLLTEQAWDSSSSADNVWSCLDMRDFDSPLFDKEKSSAREPPSPSSAPPALDDDVWCAQAVAAALAAATVTDRLRPSTPSTPSIPSAHSPPPPRASRSVSPALKRRLQASPPPAPARQLLRTARRIHQLTCVKLQATGSDLRRAALLRNTALLTEAELTRLEARSPSNKRACLEPSLDCPPPDPVSLPSPRVLTDKLEDEALPPLKPDRSSDMDDLVQSLLRIISDE